MKNKIWRLDKKYNCENYNIIYMIECNKDNCHIKGNKSRYIGETKRSLKKRLSEHIGYIVNKMTNYPTGKHFNLPGHTVANVNITILEKVRYKNNEYRKEREKYFIRKFNTFYKGMNKQK